MRTQDDLEWQLENNTEIIGAYRKAGYDRYLIDEAAKLVALLKTSPDLKTRTLSRFRELLNTHYWPLSAQFKNSALGWIELLESKYVNDLSPSIAYEDLTQWLNVLEEHSWDWEMHERKSRLDKLLATLAKGQKEFESELTNQLSTLGRVGILFPFMYFDYPRYAEMYRDNVAEQAGVYLANEWMHTRWITAKLVEELLRADLTSKTLLHRAADRHPFVIFSLLGVSIGLFSLKLPWLISMLPVLFFVWWQWSYIRAYQLIGQVRCIVLELFSDNYDPEEICRRLRSLEKYTIATHTITYSLVKVRKIPSA